MGRALFHAALTHFIVNGAKMVGLDAVEEQVPTYERRGLVKCGKVRIMMREGMGGRALEERGSGSEGWVGLWMERGMKREEWWI